MSKLAKAVNKIANIPTITPTKTILEVEMFPKEIQQNTVEELINYMMFDSENKERVLNTIKEKIGVNADTKAVIVIDALCSLLNNYNLIEIKNELGLKLGDVSTFKLFFKKLTQT